MIFHNHRSPQVVVFSSFFFFLFSILSSIDPSYSQPGFPQNLETFFPSPSPPPTTTTTASPSQSTTSSPPPSSSKTSKKSIITAVGVTAATTLILSAIAFLLCTRYLHSRRKNTANSMNNNNNRVGGGGGRNPSRVLPAASPESEFSRFDGNLKGLIVDEGGLDVLYWRKLQGSKKGGGSLRKETWETGKAAAVMGIPRGKSSSSNSPAGVRAEKSGGNLDSYAPPPLPQRPSRSGVGGASGHRLSSFAAVQAVNRQQQQQGGGGGGGMMTGQRLNSSSSAVEWVKMEEHQGGGVSLMAVPREQTKQAVAAPPPSPSASSAPRTPPPPPPPAPEKKAPAPPPPPPPGKGKPGGPAKLPPPPAQKGGSKVAASVGGEGGEEGSSGKEQVKMKPLHWEKVNVNPEHSMVWDKLDRGSFQYNGDMMEALFGVVAVNRKSPKSDDDPQNTAAAAATSSSSKTFILDPRKSQNTAIVLKSLGIPRSELIEALQDGTGLTSETLEKLARIAPTPDEQSKILAFSGDPTTLADAEQFLHHILRSVPTAFTRADAMLFKLTYDSELAALKESLRTLESACTELRGRGIFLKLLEAILKAGNRLNAGTARGDAKAFNLTTLLKLSDYKSSDGKTTLLHFVVHEVVRNEGRRCVLNKNNNNNSLSRQGSRGENGGSSSSGDDSKSKEEHEKEFLRMGLPVVGGLSAEFSNVKKAAGIDYDVLTSTLVSLGTRVSETKRLLGEGGRGEDGFDKEMRGFIAAAEMELEGKMKGETARVMELVKKTTKYYQAANDKSPLQLFSIVNDFLGMVDRACVEIARSLQQRKKPAAAAKAAVGRSGSGGSESSSGTSSPHGDDVLRTRVTFPRLPDHFLSDKSTNSRGSSSNGGGSDDEDDDFLR